MKPILETAEYKRLHGPYPGRLVRPWRKWGPYIADRAWGTVREDYSAGGTAWDYLTHDLARSKAYRWGEDGIAGLSDRYQRSEEHTSELQSPCNLVCRLLLEKKKKHHLRVIVTSGSPHISFFFTAECSF